MIVHGDVDGYKRLGLSGLEVKMLGSLVLGKRFRIAGVYQGRRKL